VRADGVGDAQAGTEVVRILNAVENQQEGRLVERVENIVEVTWRCAASTVAITPWCLAPGAIACRRALSTGSTRTVANSACEPDRAHARRGAPRRRRSRVSRRGRDAVWRGCE
jgi:hypothetical protein